MGLVFNLIQYIYISVINFEIGKIVRLCKLFNIFQNLVIFTPKPSYIKRVIVPTPLVRCSRIIIASPGIMNSG